MQHSLERLNKAWDIDCQGKEQLSVQLPTAACQDVPVPELLPPCNYNYSTVPLPQKHCIFSIIELCARMQLRIIVIYIRTVCLVRGGESTSFRNIHSLSRQSPEHVLTLKPDPMLRLVLLWAGMSRWCWGWQGWTRNVQSSDSLVMVLLYLFWAQDSQWLVFIKYQTNCFWTVSEYQRVLLLFPTLHFLCY